MLAAFHATNYRLKMRFLFRWFGRAIVALLLLYGSFYLVQVVRRPARSNLTQPLYQGVTYQRVVKDEPRKMMVHVFEVDLTADGLELFVTPPDIAVGTKFNINARKTTTFASEFDADVAVNASFFYTFTVGTPLTFYPKEGEPVAVVGRAIADGKAYAKYNGFKTLCFRPNSAVIKLLSCPLDTVHAVAGNAAFLRDGQPYQESNEYNDRAYGRVAAALDASGTRLWLILVDNKQWGYSNGASLLDLADIARNLGADWAINLDGGGSSTFVSAHSGRPRVLNSPVHTGLIGRERPVANHIGIRALPLSDQ